MAAPAAGYASGTWGENIAAGQRTPAEVVSSWMNSEGHRANILNGQVTESVVSNLRLDFNEGTNSPLGANVRLTRGAVA